MKTKLKDQKEETRVPEVGEVWRYKGSSFEVYMRIKNEYTEKLFGEKDNRFCSVDLNSGTIRVTFLDENGIEIIKGAFVEK